MNRYPLWKYFLIVVSLVVAVLYTLPNLFGESPAVQISTARSSAKVDDALQARALAAIKQAGLTPEATIADANSVKYRFKDTDAQLKAKDAVQAAVGDDYSVALNLLPQTPQWLISLHAKPMSLGLDLRGGVHFLLEVDMNAALGKQLDKTAGDIKRELRDRKIRYGKISRVRDSVVVQLRDAQTVDDAANALRTALPALALEQSKAADNYTVTVTFTPQGLQQLKSDAVKQNITTLHNRVNELGVSEPVIQQQGEGRIVVELPGVQDTAKAKDILGRTATLEVRMVDSDPSHIDAALKGNPPEGTELLPEQGSRGNGVILVKKKTWN